MQGVDGCGETDFFVDFWGGRNEEMLYDPVWRTEEDYSCRVTSATCDTHYP